MAASGLKTAGWECVLQKLYRKRNDLLDGGGGGVKFQNEDFLIWQFSTSGFLP